MRKILLKTPRLKLQPKVYEALHRQVLRRDNWQCQICGGMRNLEVHHIQFRSHSGPDEEQNLITVCTSCHHRCHRAKDTTG